MRTLIILLLIGTNLDSFAQTLRKTANSDGHVKEGKKVGIWNYYYQKRKELSIDHTTGEVSFLEKDTSKFVLFKNGQWVSTHLDDQPIPTEGFYNFYQALKGGIVYPDSAYKNSIEGKVAVIFDVDTLGRTTNYWIAHRFDKGCDTAVLKGFKKINQKWIPARIGNKRYAARFALTIDFRLVEKTPSKELDHFTLEKAEAKPLHEDVIITHELVKVFTFVEVSAEPIGGLDKYYKWVAKSLRYPASAHRKNLEGKVFIKFIIEPTGEITNTEIVKGFDDDCDQEALRVISISPKWKPGFQSGRAIRQMYVIPINFSIHNPRRK